jgi:hypothetical protein
MSPACTFALRSTFVLFSFLSFAQDAKLNRLNVFISGTSPKIKNDNYSSDKYLDVKYPLGYNAGVNYSKFFSKRFAFVTGIEFSNYRNYFSCKEYYQASSTVKGPDGSDYFPIIIADYSQKRKVHMMEIPLLLHGETSEKESKASLFFEAGPKICVEFISKIESEGTITNQGIWPSGNPYWFSFSQNNPYYNLRTNDILAGNDYTIKKYTYSAFINFGFSVPINDNFNFNCSFYSLTGLSDINKTDKDLTYTNFLGETKEYKPSKLSSSGFRIGISIPVGT